MKLDFNQNWEFIREADGCQKTVCLPHDAMLSEKREPKCKNGGNTAWFPGGRYTYKKVFTLPEAYKSSRIFFEFEGVYRKAKVYINGELKAEQNYGYTGFFVNADNLSFDKENVIEVTVDNSEEPNARWYTGSGIYRPVSLHILSSFSHPDAVKVKTLSLSPAVIYVTAETEKDCRIAVYDNGDMVAETQGNDVSLEIPNASLWSDASPYLYDIIITSGSDELRLKYGLRQLEWNKNGFFINGKETLLRGACIHHDNGILGACAFADAEDRKIRILKENGFNAIRSAHNPCSKALLDACDQYGMLVMDESCDQWYIPKTPYDFARDFEAEWQSVLSAMVQKNYNHPSVIMYSIGNEISETSEERGVRLTREQTAFLHALDDSRAVTCGINPFLNALAGLGIGIYKEDKAASPSMVTQSDETSAVKKLTGSAFFNFLMSKLGTIKGFFATLPAADKGTKAAYACLDICGYNYGTARYQKDRKKYPDRVIVGSETFPPDIYRNWKAVKEIPNLIGDFMWTGWEYLGEAGLGCWKYGESNYFSDYPYLLSGAGAIDLLGNPTSEMHFAQNAMGVGARLHIGVRPVNHAKEKVMKSPWRFNDAVESWAWNGCEGQTAEIDVYANEEVTLYLNNRKVGAKKSRNGRARFHIPFERGELKALAASGQEAALRSPDEDTVLTVSADRELLRANGQDLAFIDIAITDKNGIVKVLDHREITVTVQGNAVLQGFGSANPKTEESYLSDSQFTYLGRAQAVVRASHEEGAARVTVSCDCLPAVTVRLTVAPVNQKPFGENEGGSEYAYE